MSSSIRSRLAAGRRTGWLFLLALGLALPAQAADIALADQPFSTAPVPGNLLLALSVEWPTASTPAHLSTTAYSASSTYLGYFDPAKCYKYVHAAVAPAPNQYFSPVGSATNHACTSTAANPLWSGNYLNWASTQTIDAFRWALTGGPRVVDTTTTTILEKTNHAGQGARSSIYPDKVLASGVSGATPFSWTTVVSRVHGLQTAMYVSAGQELSCTFATDGSRKTKFTCNASATGAGSLTCSTANFSPASGGSASCTASQASPAVSLSCTVNRPSSNKYNYSCTSGTTGSASCSALNRDYAGNAASGSCNTPVTVADYAGQTTGADATTFYRVYVRLKVCDPAVGLETNCVQYGSNYKPEGLMQQYSMKLRYSAFGYLNDSNVQRDGGVMRGRMKYIGPKKPVPGAEPVANTMAVGGVTSNVSEWDETTGVMATNPDATDASQTASAAASAGYSVPITNSGVMNYLNKFGKVTTGNYKDYDPVSEMYYAGLRYFRNKGNVSAYSSLGASGSLANLTKWLDGFPVISTWDDPILYACQKNFILGIGDVNTHRDANLTGSTIRSADEPAMPAEVSGDSTIDVTTATEMVGVLEGATGLGSYSSGRNNSYFMAGLAYDAHTSDIRTDLTGKQTVNTYWLDVMEGQTYLSRNQYWLAAKYGGFDVPEGFVPYAPTNGPGTLAESTWHTSADMTGADKRPDNYFLANQADKMVLGLSKAFAKISGEAESASSTAFSTATAKISGTGSASYSANYDPETWSGVVTGAQLTFDVEGTPTLTQKWDAGALLDATLPASRKIVTCCTAGDAGLPFQVASLTAAGGLHSRTNYASFGSVPGVTTQSQANYVAYLRGDRTQEAANGGQYRTRGHVLGDVVGSKANPVGPPDAPYFDLANPGYSAFRRTHADRKTVVYVGANDGMMHAFDGTLPEGAAACADCGKELFAYIPSFVYGSAATAATSGLASYGNPEFSHHYFVDATPVNFDVDFNATAGVTAGGTPDWRTIVIGGLGKGGKGYYAIDVTNPAAWTDEANVASKVLWEFTDADMGYSYGDASVVKTKKHGWVVVFTSGYNNADGKGYFYVVNPKTGALLEKVETPEGSTSSPLNMAHQTAYVPDYEDFTADAIYAGDLQGNVWRLDVTAESGSYPEPEKIATLTSGAGGGVQPVTTRPLIEVDPNSKKRYVFIGTGRLLADSDLTSTQVQTFYGIVDGTGDPGMFYTGATLPGGIAFPITRAVLNPNTNVVAGIGSAPSYPMGWYVDLGTDSATGVAERINVAPTANVGVVAFGVNLPTGDVCTGSGTSRVFGMEFANGKTVLVNDAGALTAYSSVTSGMITDLAIRNVRGKNRILVGDTLGNVRNVNSNPPGTMAVRRLNWREVSTGD